MKKKIILIAFLMPMLAFVINSCNKDEDPPVYVPPAVVLVGQDGNPRFNLQFTNEQNVDLDLYVKTPAGNIINYSNPTADGGSLDVDCLCGDCGQGPNENIFWENGTAENGTYTYWVDYYSDCGGTASTSSNFTLRVVKNGVVLETKTGTLSAEGTSTQFTFNHVN